MGKGWVANRKPKLGAPVTRITDVGIPGIAFYPAPGGGNSSGPRSCVLICPGGGYNILAWDLEGTEVAAWLNGLGVHAAVLRYRVPRRKGRPVHAAPLQDAQRALRLLRHRASELEVDPGRLGILGFSAGGHLAALASCQFAGASYPAQDEVDRQSARPDFSLLVYPAYLRKRGAGVLDLAAGLEVCPDTPPSFAVMTADDGLGVEGPMAWFAALKRHKVPAEIHLFPSGGHGYGMRLRGEGVSDWPVLAEGFLRRLGAIPSAPSSPRGRP